MTTAYTVTPIDGGFQVVHDAVVVTLHDPSSKEGVARGVLTVRDGAVILTRDRIALTSARSRRQFLNRLAEKEITLDEGVLLALDEAIRTQASAGPTNQPTLEDQIRDAEERAGALLDDPLLFVRLSHRIPGSGWAGDVHPPALAYTAITSRLTDRPLNLAVVAPSASGKSFAVSVVLSFFPPAAYYEVKAASPRALVFSPESFEHRTVIVAEADSPAEEGPAASAMRAIISDAEMTSEISKQAANGDWGTQRIAKPGPTGLITTSTRPLPTQFSTRTLTIFVVDTPDQIRRVLHAHAASRNSTRAPFDFTHWVALQEWLELAGLRDVTIPYAHELADRVPAQEPRANRDFRQLLTAIETMAILAPAQSRQRRSRADRGRLRGLRPRPLVAGGDVRRHDVLRAQ